MLEKKRKKARKTLVILVVLLIAALAVAFGVMQYNHSNSVSYQLKKATEALDQKNYTSALQYAEHVLQLDSENEDALVLEGQIYVLMKQVEELTDGDISGKAMQISLSVGVAASVGLSMLRVLTGIPIMYFLIPGYAIALFLTLFVPKIFTAIAFDSGGVASGPMTATFLLPLAQGACTAVGGDVVKDAFGVVAMVAMTPLITLQVLGLIYKIKSNKKEEMAEQPFLQAEDVFAGYADDAIIEL